MIYDIGCGDMPFAPEIRARGSTYVGVDIERGFYNQKPDLIGTATNVPAPDSTADVVILSQVLEHLDDPIGALKEAHRLLKPGGVLLCSFPFLYPIHAPPHDFGRYTRFLIIRWAERVGYTILSEEALGGYWQLRGLTFALYLQAFHRGPIKYAGIVPLMIAVQQWLCVGMHSLETLALRLAGKDPAHFHCSWPINYVFALGKPVGAR